MLPLAASHAQSIAQASAQAAARGYRIPAGALAEALPRFADSAGVTVLFDAKLVGQRRTDGLEGTYSVNEGFARLLAGSGLEPARRADGGYTLRRLPQGEITALPAVAVPGARDSEPPSEGSGSYTVPATSAATRMPLSLRETPQSVSVITRQQMEDQGLNTIQDVLGQTTGISVDKRTATQEYTQPA
ncbi:hypothetical protein G6F50_015368 [Rhizopus delemar]|uniref:Secretin/TonB short N-terminal domain-containing protein n=1 Tax=Rhizopus delemar TaxID=936053 RepID=A0A9P6XYV5_9FUNG|nr:hypothetical protein G6F50_015368 [Rhizopus delemar]